MTQVFLLTIEQKDYIYGKQFAVDSYFNPIEDRNGDFVISREEVENCIFSEFAFLHNCPVVDYEPKPDPIFP